jgi:hypothetical protein
VETTASAGAIAKMDQVGASLQVTESVHHLVTAMRTTPVSVNAIHMPQLNSLELQ